MKHIEWSNSFKVASVYVGTVLGAGFASGQEMMQFFVYYGNKGMFGLILTGMLFGIIGYLVLNLIHIHKCKSYHDLIENVAGIRWTKFFEISVILFMFICFCAMLAGFGALINQFFNTTYYFGVILMGVICFITFLFKVKGVVLINTLLAPILLIGSLIMGLYMWIFRSTVAFNGIADYLFVIRNNWFSSTILYVGYNIITAIVVLSALGYLLKNRKVIKRGAVLSGAALGSIGIILGIVILYYYNEVKSVEIPLLEIATKYNSYVKYIYMIVLTAAIFTTAVANGFGLIERLNENLVLPKKLSFYIMPITIIVAMACAGIGFSTMVKRIYPIFGYIGVVEIIFILFYYIQHKNNKTKSR